MKIQLTQAQIAFFVDRVKEAGCPAVDLNTPTNYRTTWRQVIKQFKAYGWSPFTRKDARSVCNHLGWPLGKTDGISNEHFWGFEEATIHATNPETFPWKDGDGKKKRGYYSLRGATVPLSPRVPGHHPLQNTTQNTKKPSMPSPAPAGPPAPLPEEVEVVNIGKASADPTALAEASSDVGAYGDPLVRQATAQKTQCFGWFSNKDEACGTCPLAQWCARRGQQRLVQLASQLDLTWDEEVRAARSQVGQPSTPTPSAPAQAPTQDDHQEDGPALGSDLHGGRLIKAPTDLLCSTCRKQIRSGEKAILIPTKGSLHLACAAKGS